MSWQGVLKGFSVFVLISVTVVVLLYGMVYTLFGRPWMRLAGLTMVIASFRAIILAFDLMWGRPPGFSKRPWERRGAETPRRPPGA